MGTWASSGSGHVGQGLRVWASGFLGEVSVVASRANNWALPRYICARGLETLGVSRGSAKKLRV